MTRPETLASFISVHYEAARELSDETFISHGHPHSLGIILNRAITNGTTVSEQHSLLFGTSAEGWFSHLSH
jgi:hypothetical protein